MMPRGSYAKVSAADRARIVECADGGGDWKALCANLRVNPKTAHGWVKSGAQVAYVEEGALHRGRCKQCKKQGRSARGMCASNQCPYAGQQDNYLDGRNGR